MTRPISDPAAVLRLARATLAIEMDALSQLSDRLGDAFVRATEMLLACPGRIVVSAAASKASAAATMCPA